ncbi:hypothetical protein B1R32_101254 [Abditibacterium utsteinense]|uniref:LTXXQ motif family protein n=1 Tax=Abditibacterium utsteinense TaxID=1960156 RepID=A0A2S8SXH9_9BACT|nr:hypothetical protein [Abditibacterium utsteinense]PQV65512.1 hypothetical protein B1R32_101254 [Abditibacterium utsteinense]
MKNRRLIPLFASASLCAALSFSALSPVSAQPAPTTPKVAKAGKKARGGKRRAGLPKRMMAKIEEKMGKPLTDDQKTRLGAAYKARMASVKAAQEKFNQEASTITGLSSEEMKSLNQRGKMAPGQAVPGAMAPAPR